MDWIETSDGSIIGYIGNIKAVEIFPQRLGGVSLTWHLPEMPEYCGTLTNDIFIELEAYVRDWMDRASVEFRCH